ncbi:hypothetical protein LJC08_01640 [Methanimicrococcus sp. OttesenSCG-928-J09]|nr:hypothetical protein [Methanimicrococcus sp. OttesenSCG-928-J09]
MKFETKEADNDFSIEVKMKRREKYGFYSDFAADPFLYFGMNPKFSFIIGFILASIVLFFFFVIWENTYLLLSYRLSYLLNYLPNFLQSAFQVSIPYFISIESVFLFTAFAFFLPFIYFEERYQKKIEIMEEQMPGFFRDISNLIAGGLTLPESLTELSIRKNDEIKKPENGHKTKNKNRNDSFFLDEIQLIGLKMKSGQPFDSCLENFGKRYDSKLVQRAASVISAAEKSGGLMYLSIDAAAFDLQEAVNLKKERDSNQSVYGTVLFISFLLFIGIAVLLIHQFKSMSLLSSQSNPLDFAGNAAEMLYHMLFIQAFFSGLMIGKLRKGKTAAGLKYSFLMLFIVWISFLAGGVFAVG